MVVSGDRSSEPKEMQNLYDLPDVPLPERADAQGVGPVDCTRPTRVFKLGVRKMPSSVPLTSKSEEHKSCLGINPNSFCDSACICGTNCDEIDLRYSYHQE
jgi:hypothetical protein